jgi:hypothetical protein
MKLKNMRLSGADLFTVFTGGRTVVYFVLWELFIMPIRLTASWWDWI